MSKVVTWSAGLALAGVIAGCGLPAAASPAAGTSWGRVVGVPGLSALNTAKGGGAAVSSMSCASAGNCVAGGYYWNRHGPQGFVAQERNGRWLKATGVPGLAALNKGLEGHGEADVSSVSCASARYCAAAGYYADTDGHDDDGFVAVEKDGVWGKAAKFLTGEFGEVDAIFCTSAGNCVAGGTDDEEYFSSFHGFIAQERNGRWSRAAGVPGLRILNKGGGADVDTVWCASAGNCVAGGYYTQKGGESQGFTVAERNGRWGTATATPGLAALNQGGNAQVSSVSCASTGDCLAGGSYTPKHGNSQGFVAVDRNGHWGQATRVPGLAALNQGGRQTMVLTVSCAQAGRCAAGGFYFDRRSRHSQGFVTSEGNGRWSTPVPLPGLRALDQGGSAAVSSLSCPAPSSCAAGGYYASPASHNQGFVTETS
jgi:hypothetical protein